MNSSLSSALPEITLGMSLYIKITGNKALNAKNRTIFCEGIVSEISKTNFTVKMNDGYSVAKFKLKDRSAMKSNDDFEMFYSEKDYLDVQEHKENIRHIATMLSQSSYQDKNSNRRIDISSDQIAAIQQILGIISRKDAV